MMLTDSSHPTTFFYAKVLNINLIKLSDYQKIARSKHRSMGISWSLYEGILVYGVELFRRQFNFEVCKQLLLDMDFSKTRKVINNVSSVKIINDNKKTVSVTGIIKLKSLCYNTPRVFLSVRQLYIHNIIFFQRDHVTRISQFKLLYV